MLISPIYFLFLALAHVWGRATYPPPDCDVRKEYEKHKAFTCHVRGFFADGEEEPGEYNGARQFVSNFESCRNLCLRDPSNGYRLPYYDSGYIPCFGFAYNTDTNLCTLLDIQAGPTNFEANETAPLIFTDRRCFKCNIRCPPSITAGNLISNGDFESSGRYIGPWVHYFFNPYRPGSIAAPGSSSPRSFHVRPVKGSSHTKGIFQNFNSCPGQLYRLEMDYKSSRSAYPRITVGTDEFQYTMAPEIAETNGTWATFVTYLRGRLDLHNAPAEQFTISYSKTTDSKGKVDLYFDNIKLEAVHETPKSRPDSPELFQNGGFEAGLGEWAAERVQHSDPCYVKVVSPGLSGNFAVRFAGIPNVRCAVSMRHKLVGLSPSAFYLVNFDYSANSVNSSLSAVTIHEFDPDNRPNRLLSAGTIAADSRKYILCPDRAPCNGTFTLPVFVGLADVIFSVQFSAIRPQDKITIDDFSLKALDV